MNASVPFRWLVFLALICFVLFSAVAHAGPIQANFIYELVADRARLIQMSAVFVIFGCALLWWRR